MPGCGIAALRGWGNICRALGALVLVAGGAAATARAEDPPADYLAHVRQARTHEEQKRFSRALIELRRAVKAWPAGAEAWSQLARLYGTRGEKDVALLCALEAQRHAPGDAVVVALAASARSALAGGPERRVLLRYVALATNDGGREDASVAAGEELAPGCLLACAIDAGGNPVEENLQWDARSGLTVEAGAGPARVRAGAKPCDSALTVRLASRPDVSATVPLRVVGPLATLRVSPDEVVAHAGERVHLRLQAADAAGHRLWLPEYAWSLEGAGDPPVAVLGRPVSHVPMEDFFESHRNYFEVRRENPPAPGTKFTVVVTGDAGRVRATGTVSIAAGEAAAKAARGNIEWLHSYEDALAAAGDLGRPVFVEIMSDW